MLNRFLLAALRAAAIILPSAHGHAVEVRHCRTPSGHTRFFVRHWHHGLSSPNEAGTMTIRFEDQNAGTSVESLQYPHGMINNKLDLSSGSGCINDAAPTSAGFISCSAEYDDWIYFDYIGQCNRPVRHTLLQGNTNVLEGDGCGFDLYADGMATTGWITADDESPPVPKVNGNELPFSISQLTDSVGDSSAVVSFELSAEDDCDSSPIVTASTASGSSFGVGTHTVSITATDASGKSSTGELTITVIQRTPVPTPPIPTTSPSPPPSSQPSHVPSSSSSPSSTPSNQPSFSSEPSENPSSSNVPSQSPSSSPSSTPSNLPSFSSEPSESLSSSPSFTPSNQPSVSSEPSRSPSSSPSSTPSNQPSFSSEPSENPSYSPTLSLVPSTSLRPTKSGTHVPSSSISPSNSPTSTHSGSPSLSVSPTPGPTTSPTEVPSQSPSIVEKTVTITGGLSSNQDICSMEGDQKATFVEASITTIRSFACPDAEDPNCNAEITNACGSGITGRLLYNRLLQSSSSWQIHYAVTRVFTCETASCTSASDLASVASISSSVSTTMRSAISSGSFLSELSTNIVQSLSFDASVLPCLVVWGTISEVSSETGAVGSGTGAVGTGRFFPDWAGNSGTCLEEGLSEPPLYMSNHPSIWLVDSLEACCRRYYQWDTNSCLNVQGSGLWYVEPLSKKCVTDCAEENGGTCGGLADVFSDKLYSNPRSCCESELHWRFVEFCEAESLISSCYAGTGRYYRGDTEGSEVCVRDCDPATGDVTCGGMIEESWIALYDTAEECCSQNYNWIDNELCTSRSTHVSIGKFWADKRSGKCYDDSRVPTEDLSIQLYDSIEDCCAHGVSWAVGACLAASGNGVDAAG